MGKITKRYQLLKGFSLSTHFLVDGKSVNVQFSGGMRAPYLVRGRFSTSSPELQEAIESSKSFGEQYKLEHTDYENPEDANVEETPVLPEQDIAAEEEAPAEEEALTEDQPADGPVDHPEIETVGAAKQILLEMFKDIKPGMLPNRVKLLEVAKERGHSFSKLENI